MNGIVIAPDIPELRYARSEASRLASYDGVQLLSGTDATFDVLSRTFADMHRDGEVASWMLWISHGSAAGIQLSSGAVLAPYHAAQFARQTGAQLVYLSTCDGQRTAQYISRWSAADCIYYQGAVDDALAMTAATEFINLVSAGLSYIDAYHRLGLSSLVYIRAIDDGDMSDRSLERSLEHRIERLEYEIAGNGIAGLDEIRTAVMGNRHTGEPGLLKKVKRQTEITNRLLWAIIFLLIGYGTIFLVMGAV